MQTFRRSLEQTFREASPLRPSTALYRELKPQIAKQFERFREGMQKVEKFVSTPTDPELLRAGCGLAREALEAIHAASARLREEEKAFTVFSEAPGVQEIAFLSAAVERRELELPALEKRLAAFTDTYRRLEEELQHVPRHTLEPEGLRALLPELLVVVRVCRDVLADYELACRAGSLFELGPLRERWVEAGERLRELHDKWLRTLAPEIPCPRCQTVNPAGAKVCSGCQAALPRFWERPASTLNVGGENASGKPRLQYIQQLEEQLQAHRSGALSLDELSPTVRWFAGRIRQGRQQLRQLPKPSFFESVEAEQQAGEVRAQLEKAGDSLLSGVEALENYLSTGQADFLNTGIEKLLQGEAEMLQAQAAMPKR